MTCRDCPTLTATSLSSLVLEKQLVEIMLTVPCNKKFEDWKIWIKYDLA